MINLFKWKYWRQSFNDWMYIFSRELRNVFTDEGALLFFIFVPIFYPILYSLIYTPETIRDVPVVVVDESHTDMSREYLRRVDATPDVKIIFYCANMEEAKEQMRNREAYGIICVPSTFKSDIVGGKQTHVSIFSDMSGLLYYKSLLVSNTNVSLAMNADIKAVRSGAMTERETEVVQQPIAYNEVNLYNPAAGMASFLLPAILILVLQQTLLLGVGLLAGTAREKGRLRELIPVERHNHGLLRIVFGKSAVYIALYAVISVYCLGIVPRLFSLPQIGNPVTLLFFITPFLLSSVFFAMTLSALIRERENVILIIVFTSVLLVFLSGISWPAASLPDFWKFVSYAFPSTFGIRGFVHINNMGADLLAVRKEWDALWLLTAFYFLTCCLSYRFLILRARINTFNETVRKHNLRKIGVPYED